AQRHEKRIRKACNRSNQVIINPYHGRSAQIWWEQMESTCRRFRNLSVLEFDAPAPSPLNPLCDRTMRLQASIQDGSLWLGNSDGSVELNLQVRQRPE